MLRLLFTVLAVALSVTSCGHKSDSKSSEAPAAATPQNNVVQSKSDSGGVLTATVDPKSTSTQVVKASDSSAVKGAAISVPPGSLAVATDITVQEGATLAAPTSATELGLGTNKLTASGPTVVFTSSTAANAAQPFTVSIPMTAGSSLVDAGLIAVLYRVIDASSPGKTGFKFGILPPGSLKVAAGFISFNTTHFGAFQAVTAATAITAAIEIATTTAFVPKTSSNPFVGRWATTCAADSGSSTTFLMTTLNVGESDFTLVGGAYSDAGCTTLIGATTGRLAYVLTGDSTAVPGAKNIDETSVEFARTAYTQAVVDNYNKDKECGFTDWQIGVTKSITGNAVAGCGIVKDPAGTKYYDLGKVDGNKLYGSANDGFGGMTPETRATALDLQNAYIKQ